MNACPDVPNTPKMVYAMTASGNYCIDSTEVTSAQYLAWLATSPNIAQQPAPVDREQGLEDRVDAHQ